MENSKQPMVGIHWDVLLDQHADDFCLALGDEALTFQDPKSKQFTKLVDWFRKVSSTDYIM